MGNGVSISAQRGSNPVMEDFLKNEMATIFVEEYEKINGAKTLDSNELRLRFLEAIAKKESFIWNRMDALSKPVKNLKNVVNDDFRKLCVTTVEKIHMKNAHTWMCAVDGSEASEIAYKTTMRLRRRTDHVCLYHAYSEKNDSLPIEMKQENVRTKYETQLISSLPLTRFSFYWVDRKTSITQAIIDLVEEYQKAIYTNTAHSPLRVLPDFFVLGYSGNNQSGLYLNENQLQSNSNKSENSVKSFDSSYTSFVLRSIPFPTIIAKRLCPDGVRTYMMAVDDSKISKRGFDLLLTMINPRDTLICVHVEVDQSDISSAGIQEEEKWDQEEGDKIERDEEKGSGFEADLKSEIKQLSSNPAIASIQFKESRADDYYALSPCASPVPFPSTSKYISSSSSSLLKPPTTLVSPSGQISTSYSDAQKYRDELKDDLFKRGPMESEYVLIPCLQGKTIQDTLIEYVNNKDPDFFAIAPRTKADLSYMSEYLMIRINASIILCKN
mmetsp:Transcript_16693/g.16789  ORF Transcript_16693/g.16789 Transcript_16693/m.16789 type:complete len:498 (-) Transcript_16693:262-1755(-)